MTNDLEKGPKIFNYDLGNRIHLLNYGLGKGLSLSGDLVSSGLGRNSIMMKN